MGRAADISIVPLELALPDYWIIIDLGLAFVLDTYRLADQTYAPVLHGATGRVELDAPVALTLDFDALAS